jgi:hypothetical protein
MAKSGGAIIRSFLMFKSNVIFKWAAIIFGVLGLIPIIRFLALASMGQDKGHLQSMLLGVALLMIATVCVALQIISEVQRIQRRLVEDELERTKEIQYSAPYQAIWAKQDEWDGFATVQEGNRPTQPKQDGASA